jgi:hypothetical protein
MIQIRELQGKYDPYENQKQGGGRSPPPCFWFQLFFDELCDDQLK